MSVWRLVFGQSLNRGKKPLIINVEIPPPRFRPNFEKNKKRCPFVGISEFFWKMGERPPLVFYIYNERNFFCLSGEDIYKSFFPSQHISLKRGARIMQVIVHYPTTAKGRRELEERVAIAHAEAILYLVQNLSCSKEQKLALLQAVIDTYTERSKNKAE